MTPPHDPALSDPQGVHLHLHSLTEDLHRLVADALRLQALAHQAGLFVMTMELGLVGQRSHAA